jgi:hypothetical protein
MRSPTQPCQTPMRIAGACSFQARIMAQPIPCTTNPHNPYGEGLDLLHLSLTPRQSNSWTKNENYLIGVLFHRCGIFAPSEETAVKRVSQSANIRRGTSASMIKLGVAFPGGAQTEVHGACDSIREGRSYDEEAGDDQPAR